MITQFPNLHPVYGIIRTRHMYYLQQHDQKAGLGSQSPLVARFPRANYLELRQRWSVRTSLRFALHNVTRLVLGS